MCSCGTTRCLLSRMAPPFNSLASSSGNPQAVPRPSDWQTLPTAQAKETLGSFGGPFNPWCSSSSLPHTRSIHSVTWLVTDASPSNHPFFSLWRTYTPLDMSLSPDALTLPPPRRILKLTRSVNDLSKLSLLSLTVQSSSAIFMTSKVLIF
ncbi:hypothetical protein EV363DRAFT_1317804 [Boletus edulis]|nr:hypothetical protein EV363DRAFT_1317804 [Boletus edulis]